MGRRRASSRATIHAGLANWDTLFNDFNPLRRREDTLWREEDMNWDTLFVVITKEEEINHSEVMARFMLMRRQV